eukprot:9892477-Lingulodinium_polyedra.AAC.1
MDMLDPSGLSIGHPWSWVRAHPNNLAQPGYQCMASQRVVDGKPIKDSTALAQQFGHCPDTAWARLR